MSAQHQRNIVFCSLVVACDSNENLSQSWNFSFQDVKNFIFCLIKALKSSLKKVLYVQKNFSLSIVTNIMIKKSLRKIFMYPRLERKKCHCAKTLRRYLFFPLCFVFFPIVDSGDFYLVTWSIRKYMTTPSKDFFHWDSPKIRKWNQYSLLHYNPPWLRESGSKVSSLRDWLFLTLSQQQQKFRVKKISNCLRNATERKS